MKPEKNNNENKHKNKIISQAYQPRCSSWKLSSKARIAWDFSTLLRTKWGERDATQNRISNDFDKRRISQPITQ